MKKCNSCGININTNYDYCPFCQDKLVGESFSYYPKHKRKKMPSIFKIIVFISLIAGIIIGFIDYNINATFTWSIYCFLGLLSNIIINFSIFHSEKDIHNSIIGYKTMLQLQFNENFLNDEKYEFLKTDQHLGPNIILLGYGGSHAYGTNVPTSAAVHITATLRRTFCENKLIFPIECSVYFPVPKGYTSFLELKNIHNTDPLKTDYLF